MFTALRSRLLKLIPLVCLGLAKLATADDKTAVGPEAIVQQQPDFYVKADVDRKDRQYREEDELTISVVAEQDAYIYALYKAADGKVYQIFPNSGQPQNKVKAKTPVTFPGKDDQFVWTIDAPFGKEVVKVIASKEPIKDLNDPALRQKFFNPVTPRQVKDLAAKLDQAEAKTWTEDQVEITTHDKTWQPPPPPVKRVGVFFGVSHYEFNAIVEEETKGKAKLNLPACHTGAQVLERLFREYGKLEDTQVFINEQATRRQMEESITQWLPSVSKPGDTVVIYFSGHGGPIPPYNPTDRHVRGSYLLTYDNVPAFVLQALKNRADKLSPELAERVRTMLGWTASARTYDQADEILARRTGVPDDVFGHWLQRLAGRQIVVIFDACHSAGFASEGKSLQATSPPFDFLSLQLARLKDLGQGDTALLAACGSKETTLAMHANDEQLKELRRSEKGIVEDNVKEPLGVFSYYLAESLLSDPAPTSIKATHKHCLVEIAAYVDRLNAYLRRNGKDPIAPYAPRLFDHCSKPALVKP